MKLLVFVLVITAVESSVRIGGSRQTQKILDAIFEDEGIGRSGAWCNSKDDDSKGVSEQIKKEVPAENTFLDMANFLEYVQLTAINENSRADAIKFFNISTAAFEYGSHLVAQEAFGRAVSALENFHARRRRSAPDRGGRQPEREPIDIWDPADLFREFKKTMGRESFNQLLHLKRKVTMAFVIDSSSSMANDLGHVKKYIRQLLAEQTNSGTDAVYIVTTFADPSIGGTRVFHTRDRLMRHLDSLESKVGGDCEEKTCLGMLRAMYNPHFIRKGNAAMYIFTDAGSKDCERLSFNIIRSFQFCKASAFFILFDSCRKNIDPQYAQIAQRTGGFCLLVRDKAVYNITDTVNGAFESSSLIVGEDTYETNSRVGQGYGPYVTASRRSRNKRDIDDNIVNGYSSKKTIQIDELVESFKVSVTISPPELVEKVELLRPLDGDQTLCSDTNIVMATSVADNGVLFDVTAKQCPCVGNWTLAYPADAAEFTYSVTNKGAYTLSFDAYFVDDISGTQNSNYAPCLQVEEFLVIKINHGSQVVPESLVVKIVGLSGNFAHITENLQAYKDRGSDNTYIVRLHLPANMGSDGFRVALEGEIVRGSKFQRLSTDIFYPTSSCFRITQVKNFYAIFPKKKTSISFELSNNSPEEDVYTVVCSNSENYEIEVGSPWLKHPSIRRPKMVKSNPVLLPAGYTARYAVTINAPRYLMRGRTVIVNCVASSSSEQMIEFVRLTEMDDRFYD